MSDALDTPEDNPDGIHPSLAEPFRDDPIGFGLALAPNNRSLEDRLADGARTHYAELAEQARQLRHEVGVEAVKVAEHAGPIRYVAASADRTAVSDTCPAGHRLLIEQARAGAALFFAIYHAKGAAALLTHADKASPGFVRAYMAAQRAFLPDQIHSPTTNQEEPPWPTSPTPAEPTASPATPDGPTITTSTPTPAASGTPLPDPVHDRLGGSSQPS